MKVLLDSNIWRYLADLDSGQLLQEAATSKGVDIVVAPALVFEASELQDDALRKVILRLLSRPTWTRLMPEAFLEAQEIKAAIRRFRPEWIITNADETEVNTLKMDWTRPEGGFWSRAEADIPQRETDESLRAEREHRLAQEESKQIRGRVLGRKEPLPPDVRIGDVAGIPPSALPGWLGAPVDYWRVPSLYHLQAELEVYASPYREWIDYEVDVHSVLASPEKLTRLWYYEISALDAPRQWLRGAFELLQAYHKVTSGNPGDSQISSHLIDVDVVISADRNFVRFVEKCRSDAPFKVADPYLVSGDSKGVGELFNLLAKLSEQRLAG